MGVSMFCRNTVIKDSSSSEWSLLTKVLAFGRRGFPKNEVSKKLWVLKEILKNCSFNMRMHCWDVGFDVFTKAGAARSEMFMVCCRSYILHIRDGRIMLLLIRPQYVGKCMDWSTKITGRSQLSCTAVLASGGFLFLNLTQHTKNTFHKVPYSLNGSSTEAGISFAGRVPLLQSSWSWKDCAGRKLVILWMYPKICDNKECTLFKTIW